MPSHGYGDVLLLRDIQYLSRKETAKVSSIIQGQKIRLFGARLQMRDALAPGINGSWATGWLKFASC